MSSTITSGVEISDSRSSLEGYRIDHLESSNQIKVVFYPAFFEQTNASTVRDIFDNLSSNIGCDLSATFPLGCISHSDLFELTTRSDIYCKDGSIYCQHNNWNLILNYFITSKEIKSQFIDIRFDTSDSRADLPPICIHRMRLGKNNSLLSVIDIESIVGTHKDGNDEPTLLMQLKDVAKPGEILEMDSRQAAVEGVASCIFINKQSGTITLTPDTTSDKATLIKIEIDEEVSLPEYVQFFLSENLEDYVGSKLDYITQEDICNLPVVLPSLQAQRVICNYLSNLEKYKQAIQEKSRRLSQIKPLDVTPSQLLGHSLSLLEESVLQLTSKTGFLPSPISQALSALETNDNSKRFLCSQYIIEALIQFHVVTSSSFAIRLLGQNKLEDAYKSFQNSKWQVSLTTWKNIFDKQVNEFEKSLKNTKSLQANPALVAFGDEGYFAFSGLFSRGVLSVFNRLIDMRNEYFGHPATPSAETMELYANNVSREINAYLDQTKTLWKWLAVGICKEVVTNESHELIASMDEFSGSFRNVTHLTITVPAGLLARNSLVFYPRNNPNPETVVQGIPFTFIDRISSTVHGLYFFSRLDKEGKLVFQSYSELKESTKRFEREDPRISLLSKRIFVSQAVPDPATPTNLK